MLFPVSYVGSTTIPASEQATVPLHQGQSELLGFCFSEIEASGRIEILHRSGTIHIIDLALFQRLLT